MPTLIALALIILVVTPPSYGILVILLDTQTPPRHRTTRAVGGAIMFKSAGLSSLMLMGFINHQQFASVLPVGLMVFTTLAIARVMQLERYSDGL